ncbi:Retinol dehydrogenase 13 [Linderina macrospora]|uniref:Retinol dehydrogenase 13 n=1 Tax=Linderina macrospora TaxID=4868 RepID=A0ACC1JA54_9FUNG|nr:Retinol dehydrogenase 13 [Linderina macrospora]
MSLDLASFASIRSFVKDFKERHQTLNILVNNAGVFMCPYMTTEDGIEMQFGTNHVGHFLLTTELLDVIKKSGPARIINVASIASYINARLDKAMVEDRRAYSRLFAYCNSKLANVIFTAALARKLMGTEVTAYSLHPGFIATNIFAHIGLWQRVQNLFFINPTHGALTSIYLALSANAGKMSGKYFVRRQPTHAHPSACNVEEQDNLWKYTEDLIAKYSEQTSYGTF